MSKSKYKETKERKNWMERKLFEEITMHKFPELKQGWINHMESIPRMERRMDEEKLRRIHIVVNFKNINNMEEIQKAYG